MVIGIPVRDCPERVAATCDALDAAGDTTPRVLLLDGVDPATHRALPRSRVTQVVDWEPARGTAACFNALVSGFQADVYVLLENGARPAPGWLDALLAALAADPSHGLAGPSTNFAWNEQRAFAGAGGTPEQLVQTARLARLRFGASIGYLEPLHSLSDFCYAVRREVVERIGGGDTGYGLGPCWEMAYNARAARAGFRGVWARAAYVWRPPLTPGRQAEQAALFGRAKRRYQDQLCGLRLRGETQAYEPHCSGDACPHFAPADRITLVLPLGDRPAAPPGPSAPEASEGGRPPALPDEPLVSCLMPTRNRRPYVAGAIAAFLAQDYPARELIILDDGSDPVEDLVPDDPRIRYVREPPGARSLGAKRNRACSLARGEVLVHWDDDDWHAPWRLRYQVEELLRSRSDLCGLDRLWFFDPGRGQAWQYRYPGQRGRWVAGGTFCFHRRLWERHRFPDVAIGEDTRFLREASSMRLRVLDRPDFYVARVHGGNTSRKQTSGPSWQRVPSQTVRQILGRDYDAFVRPHGPIDGPAPSGVPAGPRGAPAEGPRVSCIMPTADRPAFVPLAVAFFRRQTYPNRELIVVDDGAEPIGELLPSDPAIRYVRLTSRRPVGAKRNLACEAATGEIIVHWDDDDWYGPRRLEHQVAALQAGQGDVVAFGMTMVLEIARMAFWRCRADHHVRLHYRNLCPGTMAYRRELWSRSRGYPAVDCSEDVRFLEGLGPRTRLRRLEEEHHFICIRHLRNTWRLGLDWARYPQGWTRVAPPGFLPETDRDAYQAVATRLERTSRHA